MATFVTKHILIQARLLMTLGYLIKISWLEYQEDNTSREFYPVYLQFCQTSRVTRTDLYYCLCKEGRRLMCKFRKILLN